MEVDGGSLRQLGANKNSVFGNIVLVRSGTLLSRGWNSVTNKSSVHSREGERERAFEDQSGELYRSFENGETWHEIGGTLSLIGNTLYSSSPGQSVLNKQTELAYEMLVYRCYYNYERFWRSRNQRSSRSYSCSYSCSSYNGSQFLQTQTPLSLMRLRRDRWKVARSFLQPDEDLIRRNQFPTCQRVSPSFFVASAVPSDVLR